MLRPLRLAFEGSNCVPAIQAKPAKQIIWRQKPKPELANHNLNQSVAAFNTFSVHTWTQIAQFASV